MVKSPITLAIIRAESSGGKATAAIQAAFKRDPDLVNRKGGPLHWEPLLYACYSRVEAQAGRSTLDVARTLLARGANPNAGFLYDGPYPFTALKKGQLSIRNRIAARSSALP